jgi:amino acid permease
MILILFNLFNLLFTYRNPGEEATAFFRAIFITFLVTFIVVCIVMTLSITDLDRTTTLEDIHQYRTVGRGNGFGDCDILCTAGFAAYQGGDFPDRATGRSAMREGFKGRTLVFRWEIVVECYALLSRKCG